MFWENICIGVVSAIFATGIILVGKVIVKMKIIPFIKNFLYAGLRVDGDWYEMITDENSPDLDTTIIKLKQVSDKIKGKIFITSSIGESKVFSCEGRIKGSVISLMTFNTNQKQVGVQSYVITIVGDGKILKGKKLFYNIFPHFIEQTSDIYHKIETTDTIWSRSRSKINKKT